MSASGCTIVFYHYVRDVQRTPFPGIKALSCEGFEAQLDWLGQRFDIIDGATFEQAVVSRKGFDRPAALLTFDDGFIDHYDYVFPSLKARRLGGIFFVVGGTLGDTPLLANVHKTHFLLSHLGADRFAAEAGAALDHEGISVDGVAGRREGIYRYDEAPDIRIKRILNYEAPYPIADRVLSAMFARHLGDTESFARNLYLSVSHIREMAAGGMTIGFHTQSHPVLSRLNRDQQRDELREGPQVIREITGQSSVPFCYPYGFPHTYNADTLAALQEFGYSMAFNTVRREAVIGQDPRFELPRFDTRDVARAHEVVARA